MDNDNLLTELGENYEYIRTIVSNEIELVKINISEKSANILGIIVVGIIALLGPILVLVCLLIALAIYLSKILQSSIMGVLLTTLIIAVIITIVVIFRKKWILGPIAYSIFSRYEKKDIK